MLEQQRYKRVVRVVIFDVQTKISEGSRVNQILWFPREQLQKSSQFRFTRWCFQILDNVELDVLGAKDFQRTVRLTSPRVMVDGYLFHLFLL